MRGMNRDSKHRLWAMHHWSTVVCSGGVLKVNGRLAGAGVAIVTGKEGLAHLILGGTLRQSIELDMEAVGLIIAIREGDSFDLGGERLSTDLGQYHKGYRAKQPTSAGALSLVK